jgi:vancomycin permeability regulator SanA
MCAVRAATERGCELIKRVVCWRGWKIIVLLLMLFFVLSAVLIIWDGVTDELGQADVALVMGAKVKPDGTPSNRLKARLDTALSLYAQGLFEQVIVSGGLGWEGYDEAEVMAQYLVDGGIPEERIIVDSRGYDTYQTALNASEIMETHGMHSVIIITQYFHVSRTKYTLARFGVSQVYSANAVYFGLRDLMYIPREVVAYYYYLTRSFE